MNLFSTRHRRLIEVSVILAFLGAAPGLSLPAARNDESKPPEISYDASFMDTDFKTQVMHLKDVTITYGKMTVRADRALATARDFKNSRWTFAGNVRINADPRGNLRSDEAVVEFEDNQLKRATATGNAACGLATQTPSSKPKVSTSFGNTWLMMIAISAFAAC